MRERWPNKRKSSGANQRALRRWSGLILRVTGGLPFRCMGGMGSALIVSWIGDWAAVQRADEVSVWTGGQPAILSEAPRPTTFADQGAQPRWTGGQPAILSEAPRPTTFADQGAQPLTMYLWITTNISAGAITRAPLPVEHARVVKIGS